MLNSRTLRVAAHAEYVNASSQGLHQRYWKGNSRDSLVGTIAYMSAVPGRQRLSNFYSYEHERDRNSLQAKFMKGMRPGGVF